MRNEVAPVAPDPPLPHLVRAAIKEGWATPDSNKPGIVDSLIAPFYDQDADPALLVKCARVLLLLDRLQEAGKAKGEGGAVAVSIQANVQAVAFLNEMIERGEFGVIEEVKLPRLDEQGQRGGSRATLHIAYAARVGVGGMARILDAAQSPFHRKPPVPSLPWVGWYRQGRGRWRKVCEARTEPCLLAVAVGLPLR